MIMINSEILPEFHPGIVDRSWGGGGGGVGWEGNACVPIFTKEKSV